MPNIRIKDIPTTASATSSTDFIAIDGATNGTRKLSADSPVFSGNVTVNGGKLQLASHTTSAGGIGFGTDVSLFRGAAQRLNLDGSSAPQFSLSVGGTQKARIETFADDLYISTLTAGKSIIFSSSSAATALTLDGSQNATFAGRAIVNSTTASTSTTTGSLVLSGGLGVAGAVNVGTQVTIGGTGGTHKLYVEVSNASTTLDSANVLAVANTNTTTGNLSGIMFVQQTTTIGAGVVGIHADRTGGARVSHLALYSATANAASEKGRLTGAGNLLIGGTTDISGSGGLKVFGTTASTSTTTGALQVAGGVGVAGALFTGGNVTLGETLQISRLVSGNNMDLNFYNPFTGPGVVAKIRVDGDGVENGRGAISFQTVATSGGTLTERVRIKPSGDLIVSGTTASTSTTTGALQVAGGVGVGGRVYAGGNLGGGNQLVGSFRNTGGNGFVEIAGSTYASQIVSVGASGNMFFFTSATPGTLGTFALELAGANADVKGSLTVSGGSITTSAPTGGAGAWELGVANTVTPTAPNRTITIEIGGTVFYLHAKTTND